MNVIKNILVWALTLESRLIVARHKPYIIAVTGSVGKTSTKDAIYSVLSGPHVCDDQHICYVRRSEKSMNSELGLPLTVIGAPNAWHSASGWFRNLVTGAKLVLGGEYPDCLILEVGADHPGDIKRVAKWLEPDIAVITRVSRTPVHVEFFKSPEEVFEEKAALATAVKKGGALILFADDERTLSLAERVKGRDVSVISYGLNEMAGIRGSEMQVLREGDVPAGFTFRVSSGGAGSVAPSDLSIFSELVTVRGVTGAAYMYPLLAAAAVGKARGISAAAIAASLSSFEAPHGRLNLLHGLNGSTLIDDTYNSSPDAATAALEALKGIVPSAGGRRIAVLGDMMELGKYAADEHRKIGREAIGTVDILYTAGQRSRLTADEAAKSGLPAESIRSFDTAEEAAEALAPIVAPGDVILVKGSQSMRMERVTRALLADQSQAAELLVRQEKEWLDKK